jgi:hypothetical protein
MYLTIIALELDIQFLPMTSSLLDHVGGAGPPLLLGSDLVHQVHFQLGPIQEQLHVARFFPHWRSRALVVLKSFVSDSSKVALQTPKPLQHARHFSHFLIF